MMVSPSRGDIWLADLEPVRDHEQGGRRPVVVVSVDEFNHGRSGMIVVVPLTSHDKKQPLHVALLPPEGGIVVPSFIKCEDVRSISIGRLSRRWGTISRPTMEQVEMRMRRLLGL